MVALLMKNSAAFLELSFAISHLGAVSLPINYRLARDEVGYILDNAGARLLLCDVEFAATVEGLTEPVLVGNAAQQDLPQPREARNWASIVRSSVWLCTGRQVASTCSPQRAAEYRSGARCSRPSRCSV